MNYSYERYVPIFKTLSDETRLKIIDMLSCKQMCACDILKEFDLSQSTLSYHMKLLMECGLVIGVREGAWMRYSLNQETKDEVIGFLRNITSKKEACICNNNNVTE